MNLTIQGKNVEITNAMRDLAEKKLSTLEKYFSDEKEVKVRVLVKIYNEYHKVETTMETPFGLVRSEVKEADFYAALDRSIDKLEDQIRRQKTRLNKKHRSKLGVAFLEEIEALEKLEQETKEKKELPVRTKEVFAQKMDLNEAIMQMEMLGHDFFVYTDDETEEVAVVYVRKNGGYGLLEIEKDQ